MKKPCLPSNKFGIYTHAKPNGEVFYVGKGSLSRAKSIHRRRNNWHINIVKKYGKESILVRFYPCLSERHALLKEQQLIKRLKAKGTMLVNLTIGGEGTSGYKFTKLQKNNVALASQVAMLNLWKDQDYRDTMTKAQRKALSKPEFRKKISDLWKDKKYRDNYMLKMSISTVETWKDPETRAKRIAGMKKAWLRRRQCKR